jgi:hypothetical protein
MKRYFFISVLILLSTLMISNIMLAQRYYRDALSDEYLYELNLTDVQIKAINKLEIQLEKELTPFLSELRNLYIELDELELQRNPDSKEIDRLIEKIEGLEDEVIQKEVQLEKKIRDLLTEEQKAVFDNYYGYEAYLGPGMGRFGYGLCPYRYRGGLGWGPARGGRGYYGYGRYNGRLYGRFGYGRGLGRGRGGRYYDFRFHRRRWIR